MAGMNHMVQEDYESSIDVTFKRGVTLPLPLAIMPSTCI